jgi:hypothetical protein
MAAGSFPDVIVIPNQSIWGGLCQGLEEQLKPFEENVPGAWRVREELEACGRGGRVHGVKIQRSLGVEDFDYPGNPAIAHAASA